jgi:hypothetical protein
MANEISYTITVTYSNPASGINSFTMSSGADSISIQNEPGPYQKQTFAVTTTSTTLPTSLIGTLGPAILRNCDSTNTIFVFANTSDTNALLQINPGEVQFFRFATSSTPAVKSNAGSPLLEFQIIGN